jgi:hypothetical protein
MAKRNATATWQAGCAVSKALSAVDEITLDARLED